jgi:hypothetical protein
MAKQSGLGDNFYVGGYNFSGDIASLEAITNSRATLGVTGIDKEAEERIHGIKDGGFDFTSFFNPTAAQAFPVLKALPTADVACSYFRGTVIGSPAASCVAKQINYDGARGDDGEFTFKASVQGNGYGLEWGRQLTAGPRTDTTATSPATGVDTLASASFGAQAYLHVFGITGTRVTVTLQDSADNVNFLAIATPMAFTAATAIGTQRISVPNTTTIRRYVRAITTGTFTSAIFAVNFVKNEEAGVVF